MQANNLPKRQAGLTGISWLLVIFVLGFFVMIGLKLTPIYLENIAIRSVVQSLENDPLVRNKTRAEIRNLITKRMKINNIYDFPKDKIKITKRKGRVLVDITYEKREPVVYNVSLVVSFSEKAELVVN